MAQVLIPLPARDYDPTEMAVSWKTLTVRGRHVRFATPDGAPSQADAIMVTGRGLDPWSLVPLLGRLSLIGLALRANSDARRAYAEVLQDPAFQSPLRWADMQAEAFDGLLLPGGHRARGMRAFCESPLVQEIALAMFAAGKPVAAICHGVLPLARAKDPATGRSRLWGRKTTSLTWAMERAAARVVRVTRFWDPDYYRTYTEGVGQPEGYMSVQAEVTRALRAPEDFCDVAADAPGHWRKTSGLVRDTMADDRPAFVVREGHYVSARWPGDTHTFAKTFAAVLDEARPKIPSGDPA